MRVLFIGTGEIGLPTLQWLLDSGKHQVTAVVTQPDKPVGRKLVLTPPATKTMALAAGLPVLQPQKIRHALEELSPYAGDIAIVAAYGQILPAAVLNLPRLGCLNVHTSILPRYRGASPIQAAIREGDAESGVTIMYMDEGLDTGDVLLTERTPITPEDTGGSLHDRLASMAPACIERALDLLEKGTAPRIPQDPTFATHCGKLLREDGRIDWNSSAKNIARLIRAYTPWPGTFTTLSDEATATRTYKVHRATAIDTASGCPVPGTILSSTGHLHIATGSGILSIEEIQAEGGKRLPTTDFLRGHPLEVGKRFGES
ncbi:MAG: methionyl-tRNA formyltransferase [Verrucomicrobiaceae bacterium]|nr:methionyl-tRNA formyltransferase [Verrucomicrobiaceae bacterium]